MKIGRNDPCPCGSGKKYKKCCLAGDQIARHKRIVQMDSERTSPSSADSSIIRDSSRETADALPAPTPRPPKPPPDPRIEAMNARFAEFEEQDYEGKIDLFLKTLDEKELMDGEMAFGMLNVLRQQTVGHGERDRFDELVAKLRERLPDVYDESSIYIVSWLVSNNLAAGRFDALPALARDLGAGAGANLDMFGRVLDKLDYCGCLDMLLETMRIGWPHVNESDDVMPWAVGEFAERAANYEVFGYFRNSPNPQGDDPVLLERLKFYFECPQIEHIIGRVDYLSGRKCPTWSLADFEIKPVSKKSRWDDDSDDEETQPATDPGTGHLYDLSLEFVGHLYREEGVSFTKAELARKDLFRYLIDRALGKLEPRESLLGRRPHHSQRKPSPRRVARVLCPDRQTLDQFLCGLLGFMNGLYFRAIALFELIPAWLRFLESRRLLDAEQRQKTLEDLEELRAPLVKIIDGDVGQEHPVLTEALQRWSTHLPRETAPAGAG